MFAVEFLFQKTNTPNALLEKSTCKVRVGVAVSLNQLHPHLYFVDTGSGLNIVSETSFPENTGQSLEISPYQKYVVR